MADFAWCGEAYAFLSAATANGLYCLAGLILSTLSWRVGLLRGWVGLLGMATWVVGLALTVMVVLDEGRAMIVTGGAVMMLYLPWELLSSAGGCGKFHAVNLLPQPQELRRGRNRLLVGLTSPEIAFGGRHRLQRHQVRGVRWAERDGLRRRAQVEWDGGSVEGPS